MEFCIVRWLFDSAYIRRSTDEDKEYVRSMNRNLHSRRVSRWQRKRVLVGCKQRPGTHIARYLQPAQLIQQYHAWKQAIILESKSSEPNSINLSRTTHVYQEKLRGTFLGIWHCSYHAITKCKWITFGIIYVALNQFHLKLKCSYNMREWLIGLFIFNFVHFGSKSFIIEPPWQSFKLPEILLLHLLCIPPTPTQNLDQYQYIFKKKLLGSDNNKNVSFMVGEGEELRITIMSSSTISTHSIANNCLFDHVLISQP